MNYAQRIQHLTGSAARQILSHCQNKSLVSFAGGLPGAEAFEGLPEPQIDAAMLQYGASEGDVLLREWITTFLHTKGIKTSAGNIIVTSGSQQGLDLAAKLWIDPGSPILVESPTYMAALQVFRLFQARLVSLESGDDGIDPEELDLVLKTEKPRFLYLNPTFQNPSGICYSESRRREIAEVLDLYSEQTVLIEDDPYRELFYTDAPAANPIVSHLKKAKWVYLGSTSKILAPGTRIGYLSASESLMPELLKLKQASDLHSSRVGQQYVLSMVSDGEWMRARLERLRLVYSEKRDTMQAVLETHADDLADWQLPGGGMFFWLKLRTAVDLKYALEQCMEQGVAFMPGDTFFANSDQPGRFLRINFTAMSQDAICEKLPVVFNVLRSLRN